MPKTTELAGAEAAGRIADTILALAEGDVPGFFRQQIAERQLSLTVRTLNSDILSKERIRVERARIALDRLGMCCCA